MRLGTACVALALSAAAACSGGGGDFVDGGPDTPAIMTIEPPFGPLTGGKRVIIRGDGFERQGAAPNRVVFGGREAPLAQALDDDTLEVIIPAADSPGEVDVLLLNENGFAMATGVFRYSDPPTVASASPASVRYDLGGTITVTGTGFQDEDAGVTRVTVDGQPALDVVVSSDTSLTFEAPAGVVGTQPDIRVTNDRGVGERTDAFRYGPGAQGGLLLTPKSDTGVFAYYYDIASDEIVAIPSTVAFGGGGASGAFRSITRTSTGLVGQRRDMTWASLDLDTQVATPLGSPNERYMAIEAVGDTVYGLDRNGGRFGTINPANGLFTQIVTGLNGSRAGLAANAAGTMFVIQSGNSISQINLTTGALTSTVSLGANHHITGMRFVGSTLYASTGDGAIMTIVPATGTVVTVATLPTNISDIEVFE